MPLDKVTLEVPMAQGQDTKTDPKRVAPGEMLSIKNVNFQNPGKASKTPGTTKIGSTQSGGNAVDTLNNELVIYDGMNVKAYSSQQNDFVQKGVHLPIGFTTTDLIANSYTQSFQDLAVSAAGYSVLVWNDSSGGVHYSVYDTSTKTFLVNDTSLNINAVGAPKAMVLGTNVVIMYWNGTNLVYRVIADATPNLIGAEVVISANGKMFGASVFNSKVYMAYFTPTDTTMRLRTLSSAFALSAETTVATGSLYYTSPCIFGDTSNNMWVGFVNDGGVGVGLRFVYFVRDASLGPVLTLTLIEDLSSQLYLGAVNIGGFYDGTNGRFFYSTLPATAVNFYPWVDFPSVPDDVLKSATASISGTVSFGIIARSVGLASYPFVQTINGTQFVFVIASHQSQLQSTYFLLGATGTVYARWAIGLAGPISKTEFATSGSLPTPQLLSSGEWVFPYIKQRSQEAQSGQIVSINGISLIDFTFAQPVQIEELGNDLYFGGARPSIYDGRAVVEQGFNTSAEFPYVNNLTSIGTGVLAGLSGGGLSASATAPSTYSYIAVYEWTDAKGNIHRSNPINAATLKLGNDGYYTSYAASLTSGSALVNVSPTISNGIQNAANFTFVGNQISGNGIAATTYLVSTTNVAWALSLNATATVASTIAINPTFYINGSASAGLNTINYTASQWMPVSCFVVTGSPTVVNLPKSASTYGIKAGDFCYIGADVATVLSVSGSTVTMTSGLTYSGSFTGTFYRSAAATSTSGLSVVTTTASFISRSFPNGASSPSIGVFGSSLAAGVITATYLNATQLTLSAPATATGAFTLFAGFDPAPLLQKGQPVSLSSGTIITAGTLIQSVSSSGVGGAGYLVISAPVATSFTDNNVYISNMACARIAVPTLRLTDKTSAQSSNSIAPRVVLYRTIANGTVYYQVSDIALPTINDPSVDYVFITDTIPDNVITGNNQLYTTGGQLQNDPLPATNKFGRFKNRLFAVPMENSQATYFSKQVVAGVPAEFSDFLVQNLEDTGGDTIAVSQMDDKMVFFKRTAIFYTAGDGPSDNGLNNDFIYPQIVSSDVGCTDPKSVVLFPDGLLFKSAKGIYKLNRGMQVSYIGSSVEAYNASTVTSSILVKDQNQVRFSLSSGEVLVYDYYLNQWIADTGITVADSTIWNDSVTKIGTDGIIYKDTNGTYTNNGAFIPISFKTGWLSFAKVQGFQRIYKLLILGDYKSPHTITISVRRDFNDTVVQTVTIPVLSDPGVYQFRVFMEIQKCEALQFEVVESQTVPYGEGFSLSSLAVEVGVKRGLDKIKAGASYG